MSAVAATTIAALLIAAPSTTDADRLAANGGFLLGNAERCGIAPARIVRAGQLDRDLINAAASGDAAQRNAATERFTRFFIISAVADQATDQFVASCPLVAHELTRLETHPHPAGAKVAAGPRSRPGDGE
jgi:F0F1-type ATP synthase membrane subunit c/vacuolar-type H+-ATPase subunit K